MDNYGGYDPNQGQYDQNQAYGQQYDQGFDPNAGYEDPYSAPVQAEAPKSNAPKIIAIVCVVAALAAAVVVLLLMNNVKGTYEKKGMPFEIYGEQVYEDITLELDGKNFTLTYGNITYNGEVYPELTETITGTYKKNGNRITFYVDGEEFDNAEIKKGGKTLQFFDSDANEAFTLDKK